MKHPDPDTALLTDRRRDLGYVCPCACVYMIINIIVVLMLYTFWLKGEASKQQEGLALYQGGPQPPLLSRRQSLETQYLTHRLQVQSTTDSTHWLSLYSVIYTRYRPAFLYQAKKLLCVTSTDNDLALPWCSNNEFKQFVASYHGNYP